MKQATYAVTMMLILTCAGIALTFLMSCTPAHTPINTTTSTSTGTSTATQTKVDTTPAQKPSVIESTCPAPGKFQMVDLSQPVTPKFLAMMKYLKIGTACRYYDWAQETIRNKTLTAKELKEIHAAGLKACVVFQHNNSKLATFQDVKRGAIDAKRSLQLAHELGQPVGSTIFFGVDFDPSKDEIEKYVKRYAKDFSKAVRDAGYKVGAYGSGLTLRMLEEAGLIDYQWLSMSTGFRETKTFTATNKWEMLQTLDRNCGGINVDFNYVNREFGAF